MWPSSSTTRMPSREVLTMVLVRSLRALFPANCRMPMAKPKSEKMPAMARSARSPRIRGCALSLATNASPPMAPMTMHESTSRKPMLPGRSERSIDDEAAGSLMIVIGDANRPFRGLRQAAAQPEHVADDAGHSLVLLEGYLLVHLDGCVQRPRQGRVLDDRH